MLVQFTLTQKNKDGKNSFKAVKNVNIGNNDFSDVSKEISIFTKDIINLCENNKKLGYKSAFNGIKKSLPMTLKIVTEDENLQLNYRNYGKFAYDATQKTLQKFLKNNIEFTQKWG